METLREPRLRRRYDEELAEAAGVGRDLLLQAEDEEGVGEREIGEEGGDVGPEGDGEGSESSAGTGSRRGDSSLGVGTVRVRGRGPAPWGEAVEAEELAWETAWELLFKKATFHITPHPARRGEAF